MSPLCRRWPLIPASLLVALLAACLPLPNSAPQAAQPPATHLAPAALPTVTIVPAIIPLPTLPLTPRAASTAPPVATAETPAPTLPAPPDQASRAAMPKLAFATIITDDLPSGYQVLPDIYGPKSGVTLPYAVANSFGAERPGHIESLVGLVVRLASPTERARFDRSLVDKTWPAEFGLADPGQLEDLAGLAQIGDVMAGLTGRVGEDYLRLHGDLVAWRRGDVAAVVAYMHLQDAEDPLAIGDVAQRLDERITWALAAVSTERPHLTPTPAARLMPAPRPTRTPVAWDAHLTPTLTLGDMPAGFTLAIKEMGTKPLDISADSPYAAVSAFTFGYAIYTYVNGFVLDLPGPEQQASFDAVLQHPDKLFQAVCGVKLTERGNNPNAPGEGPFYADLAGLGDAARQMTITGQGTFFGDMDTELVCLRRGSLGACVAVESLYPGEGPRARALAGLLDDRMRRFAATKP